MAELFIGPTRHRWNASMHVLQHALGLDDYGEGTWYRNHYIASPGHHSWDVLVHHVASGRMERHGPREIFGGGDEYCFVVTDDGKRYVREHSIAPPKMTRSQRRYREWLMVSDVYPDLSFGEWMKGKRPDGRHV